MAEAKQRAGQPQAAPAQSVNLQVQDVKAELVQLQLDTTAALKAAAEERQTLLDRLAALETAASAPATGTAASSAPVRLSDSIYTQCSLAVVYTEDELPVLKAAPDKEAKRNLALIQANLAHWAQAGMIPATFENLLAGNKAADIPAALAVMKEVVGEQIWERFFSGKDVVPSQ